MNVRGQETPAKVGFRLAWMDWQVLRTKPMQIKVQITSAVEHITFNIW